MAHFLEFTPCTITGRFTRFLLRCNGMGTYLPSINGVQAISNRIGSVHREVWKIGRNPGNSALTALYRALAVRNRLHADVRRQERPHTITTQKKSRETARYCTRGKL